MQSCIGPNNGFFVTTCVCYLTVPHANAMNYVNVCKLNAERSVCAPQRPSRSEE